MGCRFFVVFDWLQISSGSLWTRGFIAAAMNVCLKAHALQASRETLTQVMGHFVKKCLT
jgi:hypothetical protein